MSRTQPRLAAIVFLAIATFTVASLPSVASAQATTTTQSDCSPDCDYDTSDEWRQPEADPTPEEDPAGDPDSGSEPSAEPGDSAEPEEPDPCFAWEFEPDDWRYERYAADAGERPDDDAILYGWYCESPLRDIVGGVLQYVFWDTPTEDEGDLEQALLDDLYERVLGNLPDPQVFTNPIDDRAAIVNLPTFVSVENWPEGGTITDSEGDCDSGVCVIVTAEANLVYDPGQPGVEPIACQGPGQSYQTDIYADAFQQATWDETCTHAYTMRTGTGDRPEQWPAQVEIHWTITGYRGSTDTTEDLDPAVTSTPIPRQVNEVHTVITE